MAKWLRSVVKCVLDFLFPPACPSCGQLLGERERFFCELCEITLISMEETRCALCGIMIQNESETLCRSCQESQLPFDDLWSAFEYGAAIRDAIHHWKYQRRASIGPILSCLLCQEVRKVIWLQRYDVIVPVPLHIKRWRERGFNQSLVLAEGLGRALKKSVSPLGIQRIKDTLQQQGLNVHERAKNVHDAFQVMKAANLTGKNVLIVDDIYTTGSTATEIARILKNMGVYRVGVVTLARVFKMNG